MNAKEVVKYLEDNLQGFEYVVLKDVLMSEEEFIEEMNSSSMLKLVENNDWIISHITQRYTANSKDAAVDNSRNTTNFDLHTDGTYYTNVPEIVGLYCINPGVYNAITYIADTHKALGDLETSELSILKQLQYSYIGKDKDSTLYTRSVIEKDPLSGEEISNIWSRWSISPLIAPGKELPNLFTYSSIVSKLASLLETSICYEHQREKWDLFLFNNNKYLHGRKGTKEDPERHLWRIWMSLKR